MAPLNNSIFKEKESQRWLEVEEYLFLAQTHYDQKASAVVPLIIYWRILTL